MAGIVWGGLQSTGGEVFIFIFIFISLFLVWAGVSWQWLSLWVRVCPAWGEKQLQEKWEIPSLAGVVMVLGNAAGWIYGKVGGYLLPALLSPV